MIRNCDPFVSVENARGGIGTLEKHTLLNPEECTGKMTMCAKFVLPPHTSIGYHPHPTNVEHYYILSGKGVFVDENGERKEVGPADMCLIKVGESHGLENPYDEPMEMLALMFD